MSASLVGSEMCIRDRLRRRRDRVALPSGFVLRKRAQRVLEGVPLEVAVSYTHLTLPTICSV
eukprot:1094463-Alexandrium_andersonii.AAC.1